MTHINRDVEINITGLKVKTIIGVYEEEKNNPQTLFFDIKIKYDASKAMHSDNLEDAIDYFQISKLIKEKIANNHFELLEKLLDFTLKTIMKLSQVKELEVTIHKPEALKKFGADVSITTSAKK